MIEFLQTIRLVYLPQAVFTVRPVTRCTSSLPGHEQPVLSAQFSPNGQHLASGSGDKTVRLWDLQTELPFKTCEGHSNWVLGIAWAPNGKKLASCCKNGVVSFFKQFLTNFIFLFLFADMFVGSKDRECDWKEVDRTQAMDQ